MSPVSTPVGEGKGGGRCVTEQAVTPLTAVAAPDLAAVTERGAEAAAALARVHQAAERYRAAAAELEEWRQGRQAAMVHAKAAGANAHQIAEAAGISDQRTSLILAKATCAPPPPTRPRKASEA
jgi:hypothetical protein